jgi:nucleoside-diphosphate-sugar epimerase
LLSDEKILITGPAGRIAFGIAESLVGDNEVWGIARFSDPSTREKVESLGVTTREADIASGQFGDLPNDFSYLLHIAADFSATDRNCGAAGNRNRT